MPLPQVNSQHIQLCYAGAYLGSIKGESAITVEAAASECRIDVHEARRLFPTDDALRSAVREFAFARLREYAPITPGASIEEQINELVFGAFRLAATEGHAYRMIIKYPPATGEFPEVFTEFAKNVYEQNIPRAEAKIRAILLGLDGLCFLIVYGVARSLSPVVKNRLFDTFAQAATRLIYTDDFEKLEPSLFTPVEPIELAAPERTALYDAAILSCIDHNGAAPLLNDATTRAGISLGRAHSLIDGDAALLNEMIQYAENKLAHYQRTQFVALPDQRSRLDRLKAMALGYIGYAIENRDEYVVGFLWANTPIVPSSPLREEKSDSGADVFGVLLKIIGEESPNPLTQFEFAFLAWSLVSGIADVMSNGFLSDLPEDRKWAAASEMVDAFCSVF